MKLRTVQLDWIDALKAFAIFGILLNHFVEVFGPGPWFTNPSSYWPDFATRMHQLMPIGHSFWWNALKYLGWLGDSCPGIFILLSGFSLTFSVANKGWTNFNSTVFYRKRLFRLYPLYIAIHLIILFLLIFAPGNKIEVSGINTLLSLVGLRYSDALFFYINPSWWFIWLILQLYLIFPVLIMFLQKSGMKWFLFITIMITLFSRWAGILGIRYNSELYYWMTGSFFGTRLAEFSVGMGLAFLYHQSSGEILNRYNKKRSLSYLF
jgi:peptidoglycan/LPS O-acetylase OafA/YrhL